MAWPPPIRRAACSLHSDLFASFVRLPFSSLLVPPPLLQPALSSLFVIVHLPPSRTLLSGAEDGFVKLWDPRAAAPCVWSVCPAAPSPGTPRWVGAVAVDGDAHWMACGGGAALTLWHLPSRALFATLPATAPTQAMAMHRDGVGRGLECARGDCRGM